MGARASARNKNNRGAHALLGPSAASPTRPVKPDRCRHCGEGIDWRGHGLAFGDGTVAHLACDDAAERLLAAGRRVVGSPDRLADPAEVMLRGELP